MAQKNYKILNIFDFNGYRKFIKSWIEAAKKAQQSNLSRLAEAIQVHPTFLSHVLNGHKELSLEQAALASVYIGLSKLEPEPFGSSRWGLTTARPSPRVDRQS